MPEPDASDEVGAGRFYDSLRSSGLSSAELAHGDAYIGQECVLSPEEIAAFAGRAGISAGTVVLDIGSGIGGPACYLAGRFACRVVGVDPSGVGHAQAEARARAAGLGHLVEFRRGDIHRVELPPASFDVIVGLDAWCHIPRRAELLRRCATLLRAGGRLAFYDHVVRRPMSDDLRERLCALWHFAGLETPESYLEAVRAAGFHVLYHEETSALAGRFYSRLLDVYVERRAAFEAARGPERYQQGLERLRLNQRLAVEGVLGQLACIAERPAQTRAS
jgi:cyclopropane fatty-acyl-phospholipid synthase-like methyltransferase